MANRIKEYKRVYRNAKAKERRLKKNHNVDVDFKILTPTEWQNAPNKKREISKLDRFTDRDYAKYDYVSLGKESIRRREYNKIAEENQRIINNINYHKTKVMDKLKETNYMVYDKTNERVVNSDQTIEARLSAEQQRALSTEKNRSQYQNTYEGLLKYQKALKERLKKRKNNAYAKLQKTNYIDKLEDFSKMFKNTIYENEYMEFMEKMKQLSPEDYDTFYYSSNMGDIENIPYISDEEIGTPEGQEKIYRAMTAIKKSWDTVETQIST